MWLRRVANIDILTFDGQIRMGFLSSLSGNPPEVEPLVVGPSAFFRRRPSGRPGP